MEPLHNLGRYKLHRFKEWYSDHNAQYLTYVYIGKTDVGYFHGSRLNQDGTNEIKKMIGN